MTEKSEMQDKFIEWLQSEKIDFFRIGNSGFKAKVRSPYSYGISEDGRPCHKYWPDITFPYCGKVYMIEFGLPGAHKNRKIEQENRMRHWFIHGGIRYKIFFSWEETEKFLASLRDL